MPSESLTFGSIYTNLGGFDLGFERAGWQCVWQVENNAYCQRVLHRHWPDVTKREDVLFVDDALTRPLAILASFPGVLVFERVRRRSFRFSLMKQHVWPWYLNWVKAYRPACLVIEFSKGFLKHWWDIVRQDLRNEGYGFVECYTITAGQFGAWHVRRRFYVIALLDAVPFCHGLVHEKLGRLASESAQVQSKAYRAARARLHGDASNLLDGARENASRLYWLSEPQICRVVDGVPSALDRSQLKALSKATVPAVAEAIANALRESIP